MVQQRDNSGQKFERRERVMVVVLVFNGVVADNGRPSIIRSAAFDTDLRSCRTPYPSSSSGCKMRRNLFPRMWSGEIYVCPIWFDVWLLYMFVVVYILSLLAMFANGLEHMIRVWHVRITRSSFLSAPLTI